MEANIERHPLRIDIDCACLIRIPPQVEPKSLIVLALHGYGSNPEDMLRLTLPLMGEEHIVAALQAPYQHYASLTEADGRAGYNWGIRQHWDAAVRVHHELVNRALEMLQLRFGISARRTVLVGFSQPVGLNYRYVATCPSRVGGVIGLCGGVPRDWDESKYGTVDAAILHIARDEDIFYPVGVASTFQERLRKRAADVEFHMLPGGHRFPSAAVEIVRRWTGRVFGTEKNSAGFQP
jgi:predicted esterase